MSWEGLGRESEFYLFGTRLCAKNYQKIVACTFYFTSIISYTYRGIL